jgi:hypothetical protein
LSSDFTPPIETAASPPPLIGALLRIPFETVRARLLAGLHERGYSDLIAVHLDVFEYPGPDGTRPSELAAQTRMSKRALNYLLRQLEDLDHSPARPTTATSAPSGSASPPKETPRSKKSETPRSKKFAKSSARSKQSGNSNSARQIRATP